MCFLPLVESQLNLLASCSSRLRRVGRPVNGGRRCIHQRRMSAWRGVTSRASSVGRRRRHLHEEKAEEAISLGGASSTAPRTRASATCDSRRGDVVVTGRRRRAPRRRLLDVAGKFSAPLGSLIWALNSKPALTGRPARADSGAIVEGAQRVHPELGCAERESSRWAFAF